MLNEVLSLLPDRVLEQLCSVLNSALTESKFPKSWNEVAVTLMTKKSPAEWLNNQQPVALCNTVNKLFSIIVTARLTLIVEEDCLLEAKQEGGSSHRGTL
jgi:hypothetical protein